jgi:bacteriocin biosynthesis cyclodehydratase domain-containing protein
VTGGRDSTSRARPPAPPLIRLKRSVQVFPSSDGSLYLVRLGAGDDLAISEPRPAHRRLLDLLGGEFVERAALAGELAGESLSEPELEEALELLEEAGVLETRAARRPLDAYTGERYDRQLIYLADLAERGESADRLQERLAGATVAVLGCGGLGSWAACGLSCAGAGRLILIDDDRIELSNLNRQLLFAERRIGELKTTAAGEALREHNPELEVVSVARRVRCVADVEEILDLGPDLLIATADWPPHELPGWVNEACMARGVAWIGAGQFPPKLRVGPLVVPGRTACHECLEIAARRDYPLYGELARWRGRGQTPDAGVGPVCGVIGSLLASEAMHFLAGREPASAGHALLLDLQTMELRREPVERQPDCDRCNGAPLRRASRGFHPRRG